MVSALACRSIGSLNAIAEKHAAQTTKRTVETEFMSGIL